MTSTHKRAPCNVIFKDKMAARLSNGRFVGKGKKKRTAALLKGAVTYHRIALTDAERTEKVQKKCLSGGESRLGGDEGRR